MGRIRHPVDIFLLSPNVFATKFHVARGSVPEVEVSPVYFDRADVKKAIHAPQNVNWVLCADINVLPHDDASPEPAFTVLPTVIEKSHRSVIAHGLTDMLFIAEGTRIALQK